MSQQTPDLLAKLAEAQDRLEVLVDVGAYELGAGPEWRRIRKVSPGAKFPVHVFGSLSYRPDEIIEIREVSHGRR